MNARRTALPVVAVAAVAVLAPLVVGNYWVGVLTTVGIFCSVGVGQNLVMGYAGQFSLAPAMFFGIGAYASALSIIKLHVSFWPGLALGALAAGVFGLVIGSASLRFRGIYFAIVTFVALEVVNTLLVYWRGVTGGPDGLLIPYHPSDIGPISFGSVTSYYYLAFVLLAVASAFVYLLMRSRSGRALSGIREDDVMARALGIEGARYKLKTFCASAVFSGLAGGILAPYLTYIAPTLFDINATLQILEIVVIGGLAMYWGPLVGALIVVALPEVLSATGDAEVLVFGVAVIVMILVFPQGVVGGLAELRERLRRAPTAAEREAPAAETPAEVHVSGRLLESDVRHAGVDGPILSVEGVTKSYRGVRALEDVNVEVHQGELLGLIGPNGAGKTTLFDVVTGFARCDSGEVVLGGRAITRVPVERIARDGLVRTFQLTRVFAKLTVRENVMIACHTLADGGIASDLVRSRASRTRDAHAREATDDALEFFGLADTQDVPAGSLSYGRARILSVAMAAVCRPSVLLLDEPAAGLNQNENAELAAVIRRLNDMGTTIWLVEHNMTFLTSIVDRIVVLAQGRVIADGSPQAVQEDPNVASVYLGHYAAAQ